MTPSSTSTEIELARMRLIDAVVTADERPDEEQRQLLADLLSDVYDAGRPR